MAFVRVEAAVVDRLAAIARADQAGGVLAAAEPLQRHCQPKRNGRRTLLPVMRATMSATRRQCADVRPA